MTDNTNQTTSINPATGTNSTSINYASYLQRLMASITDSLILGLLPLLSTAILFSAINEVDFLYRLVLICALAIIPYFVFRVIYYSWFISEFGATPGKQIWGVVVTDENDQTLSFGMAFFRESVLKLVSGFSLGLGYLWMIGNAQKQTWHDMLAGTLVKSTNKSVIISMIWFFIILIVQAILIIYLIGKVPDLVDIFSNFFAS